MLVTSMPSICVRLTPHILNVYMGISNIGVLPVWPRLLTFVSARHELAGFFDLINGNTDAHILHRGQCLSIALPCDDGA